MIIVTLSPPENSGPLLDLTVGRLIAGKVEFFNEEGRTSLEDMQKRGWKVVKYYVLTDQCTLKEVVE